jgi:hypothetical protein
MSALSITPPFPTFAGKDGLPLEDGYIWLGSANQNPQTSPLVAYWDETLTQIAQQPIRTLGGYPAYSGTPARLFISAAVYSILVQDKNGNTVYTSPSNTGPSTFVNFSVNEEVQVATAGQTVFTLANTYSPGTNSLTVYVDGVNQYDGAQYSFVETNGNTVTFTSGLHVNALVKFSTAIQLSGGATDSSQVSYVPAGAGAVTTNVQTKLRESVSVKDFGAVGDGVADDTSAIQAAMDAISTTPVSGIALLSGTIVFPPGVYNITDEIVLPAMVNCEITSSGFYGDATQPPRTISTTIIWVGATSPDKAIFRSPAGTSVKSRVSGISLDAAQKAGYCFKIEGIAGATRTNTWQFYSCHFSGASKVGVMIGTFDNSYDLDSYQCNFWECLFDKNAICIYANAQNNYGPFVERCYFADSIQPGSPGYTINYIRTRLSGDFRIYNSFFSALAPASTVIDPETGVAVVDSDIFCCYLRGAGTVSDCWTEETRVLKHVAGSAQPQACLLANINVNTLASADARGRNLNWSLGDAAYSVYNEGQLTISNCQFGGASGSINANFYRRIYNNGALSINCAAQQNQFLGSFGQVIHGATSEIVEINGQNPNAIVTSPNWALSNWQDANTLLDNVLKFNGATAVSTVTKSASNVLYGSSSAEVVTSVAATTFSSGLEVRGNTTLNSKIVTLIVAGYAGAGAPTLRANRVNSSMTPINTTDGNLTVIYDSVSKRFVGVVSYSLDNALATNFGSYVGISGTGTIYYNVATFISGAYGMPAVTAMLPFLGSSSLATNGFNSIHYGTAAPTVGTWQRGDILWKRDATSGATPGYVCTVAGTPGTWVAMANLA